MFGWRGEGDIENWCGLKVIWGIIYSNQKLAIVVYFDQRTGALHVFAGQNQFFDAEATFSVTNGRKNFVNDDGKKLF